MSGWDCTASSATRQLPQQIAKLLAAAQAAGHAAGGTSRLKVWSLEKLTLYRYRPLLQDAPLPSRPLLVCFALVNRPTVLDLQPDRSLIRVLLESRRDVYLIDWGDPDPADRVLGLDDYVERYLGGCVRHLLRAHRVEAVDLLGVCQGGTLALCYAALHPQQIAQLITLTTPVDFQTGDDLLSKWVRAVDIESVTRAGNVPGALLNGLFLALRPFSQGPLRYLKWLEQPPQPAALTQFARLQRWIYDNPDQPATAFRQFVQWMYQENRLVRGTLELAGQRVQLARIVQPLLNLYALRDHIVPPEASIALAQHISSQDYLAHGIDAGHIGLYASQRSFSELALLVGSWLQEHRR